MEKFVGDFNAKLDDKGRLIFPAAFKGILAGEADSRFVVKKDIFAQCLQMWPYEVWAAKSDELQGKLNFFNERHAKFWRQYMRDRAIVEPDPKMGRINVPGYLLKAIGVTKDVVFSGKDHIIEIWAKELYDCSALENEEYLSIAGELSEIG